MPTTYIVMLQSAHESNLFLHEIILVAFIENETEC